MKWNEMKWNEMKWNCVSVMFRDRPCQTTVLWSGFKLINRLFQTTVLSSGTGCVKPQCYEVDLGLGLDGAKPQCSERDLCLGVDCVKPQCHEVDLRRWKDSRRKEKAFISANSLNENSWRPRPLPPALPPPPPPHGQSYSNAMIFLTHDGFSSHFFNPPKN